MNSKLNNVCYKRKLILALAILMFVICSCSKSKSTSNDDVVSPTESTNKSTTKWIYIDNGEDTIIDGSNVSGFVKIDENLLSINDDGRQRYLIREGIENVSVNGLIRSNSKSNSTVTSTRLAKKSTVSSVGNMQVILKNVDDSTNIRTTTTNSDGSFSASIPTGSYSVIANDAAGNTVKASATVVGENVDLGAYTLAASDMYNFKSEIIVDEFYYGYPTNIYKPILRIHNTGIQDGKGLSFDVTAIDSAVNTFKAENILGTIPAGAFKDVPLEIAFNTISDIRKIVKIHTKITDISGHNWEDDAPVTVYRRSINIRIKALSRSVKGYLIMPGHNLVPIDVSNGLIKVPHQSDKIYKIVLSNPDLDEETAYSIGIDTLTNDISQFKNTGAFEPDSTEILAPSIKMNQAISAFLHVGDLDIYKIDMTGVSSESSSPVVLKVDAISSYIDNFYSNYCSTCIGNADGVLNMGETAKFQLGVRNTGSANAVGVSAKLSLTDQYLALGAQDTSHIEIDANEKLDMNGSTYTSVPTTSYYEQGYYITASANTPANYKAWLKVELKDAYGNTWNDSIQIRVLPIAAKIVFNSLSKFIDSYYASYCTSCTGNSDGFLNKGETAKFQIGLQNIGESDAMGVSLKLSLSDPYLTIGTQDTSRVDVDAKAKIDMNGNSYTSEPSASYYEQGYYITALENTPSNYSSWVKILISDSFGNMWVDSTKITVLPTAAQLSYNAISAFIDNYYSSYCSTCVGNNDGILNKGETAKFQVGISNAGLSGAIGVSAKLNITDQYVTLGVQDTSHIDIGSGEKRDLNNSTYSSLPSMSYYLNGFYISTSASTPLGYTCNINMVLTDKFGNSWSSNIPIAVK